MVENPVVRKVFCQPLVHDHVRRHDEKIRGQVGAGHALFMETRPDDRHCHRPRLARAGRHLESEPAQMLGRQVLDADGIQLRHIATQLPLAAHAGLKLDILRERIGLEEFSMYLNQRLGIPLARHFHQPHQRLHCLALAEVIPERHAEAGDFVLLLEPVGEQTPGDVRGARIPVLAPRIHRGADLRHQQPLARAAPAGVFAPTGRRGGVFDQEGDGPFPRAAGRNLREVLLVGDHGGCHDDSTSTSNDRDVSLPKMSITLTNIRYVPGAA